MVRGLAGRALTLSPAQARRIQEALLYLLAFGGVVFLYWFTSTAGELKNLRQATSFYDDQANAFLKGQLHLEAAPHPDLLKAENPYDRKHIALWNSDMTLYGKHYYTYWGPLPALILAALKLARDTRASIGDAWISFSFAVLFAAVGLWLVETSLRRFFPRVPFVLRYLSAIGFVLVNPTTHLIAAGGTYQTAIIGAQTFWVLGLAFASNAVWRSRYGHRTRLLLLAAGTAFAFAISCRLTAAFGLPIVLLATVSMTAYVTRERWKRWLQDALWLGTPVGLAAVGLLIYNKLRFESFFEFGTRIQLAAWPIRFSPRYIIANLFNYWARPPEWSCRFPYILQRYSYGREGLPEWFPTVDGYQMFEPVVGALYCSPLVWLLPTTWALLFRRNGTAAAPRRLFLWFAVCLLTMGNLTWAATLGLHVATQRYMAEVMPSLVLLAILGSGALYERWSARPRPRLLFSTAWSLLAIGTALGGFLLGIQAYGYLKEFDRAQLQKFPLLCQDS